MRPPSRLPHLRRPWLPFSAILAVLFACGRGEPLPEGPANALLSRRPDRVLDEPGELLPDADEQWGARGLGGWELVPGQRDGERAYVDMKQPRAELDLPLLDPEERVLELELSAPGRATDELLPVTVYLNDVELGRPQASGAAETFRIEAPAPTWRTGANVLALEVPHDADGGWPRVRAWRVAYGARRAVAVDLAARTARLAPSTGLEYLVEAPAPARLVLAGEAGAPGALELAVTRVAARTGKPLGEVLLSGRVPTGELAEGTVLDLPEARGELLSVALRWRPDGEGTGELLLTRADVHAPRVSARPPVVFISIDTLSARHLSLYGYERDTSPRLTELAAESVVFDRCLSNAPWTLPSYLSVMTGLYPDAHQMDVEVSHDQAMMAWDSSQIAPSRWTLAEMLRALGYDTLGIIDTHWLLPKFRVDQGFDRYDVEPALIGIDDPKGGIGLIHHKVRHWLDTRTSTEPYFLFVHALDAHGPYLPGEEWIGAFDEPPPPGGYTQVPAGSAFQTYRAMPDWMARTLHVTGEIPTPMPLEPVIQRYDDAIRKCDEFIGKILDELRARDLYDQALVVISADHGESFAHDFYSHGAMWEDIEHVPLIIKLPGGERGGTRVAQPVQLVDLFPTMMEALGLASRDYLHGRSLLPLARGESLPSRPLFSAGGHCEQYLVDQDDWKLVVEYPAHASQDVSLLSHPRAPRAWLEEHYPTLVEPPLRKADFDAAVERLGKPAHRRNMAELRALLEGPYVALYNVRDDPAELVNRIDDEPAVAERLQRALVELRARTEAARQEAEFAPPTAPLDAAALAELEKLGYFGGSPPDQDEGAAPPDDGGR